MQVVLDASRFEQILANPAFLEAFPFMKAAAQRAKAKGCKCSRSTTNKARDINALKVTIAGMPTAKKQQLKTLLGATEVRMTYTNARRLVVEHTF